MEYITDISEPRISSFGGAHSIDQLALGEGGTTGTKYTIEVGFDVDHGLSPSSPRKPHLFIFVNPDNYGPASCYNCEPPFVPVAGATIAPGEAFEPSTARISLGVKYSGGNWWIWVGNQWIGYVPDSYWGGHFTSGEWVADYGEVFDAEAAPASEMGDGSYGASAGATFMTAPIVVNTTGERIQTTLHEWVSYPSLYSIGDVNSGSTEWHFGGPGLGYLPKIAAQTPRNVTRQSAELATQIEPAGFEASYFFEYGTSPSYGAKSSEGRVPGEKKWINAYMPVTGLASCTTYDFLATAVKQSAKMKRWAHIVNHRVSPQSQRQKSTGLRQSWKARFIQTGL
jgi:hypothetical protein